MRAPIVAIALLPLVTALPARADSVAQVADINPGPARGVNEVREHSALFHDQLYFAAQSSNGHVELWRYDGVSAPTLAAAINPGGSSFPGDLLVFGDRLCFSATDATFDRELYCYDGSNPPVKINIRPIGSSYPTDFVVFLGQLYFAAEGDANGIELWRYDGVNAPLRVTDLAPGSGSGLDTILPDGGPIVWNGRLYFIGQDGTFDDEIYRYDGASAPQRVSDSAGSAEGAAMAIAGPYLYFVHSGSGGQPRLWRYDGTQPPVELSATLEVHGSLAGYGGDLYLWGEETAPGSETAVVLWRYDGSAFTNLSPVRDFGVGGAASREVFAGALYFIANADLYRYDGTGEPVSALGATFAGVNDYPENGFAIFAGRLFFAARHDSGGGGEELWALMPSAPDVFADGFEKWGALVWSAATGLDE